MQTRDWRLPENRREAFIRLYSFHLKYQSHPGGFYYLLPAIAEKYGMGDAEKAWLIWLTANCDNAVTSMALIEAAPTHNDWEKAVAFWNENFKGLEWDTDRRHQKSKFGEATVRYIKQLEGYSPEQPWLINAVLGFDKGIWTYARSQPFIGPNSAWNLIKYARILYGDAIPDIDTFKLEEQSGSWGHRNSLAFIAGDDSAIGWHRSLPLPPKEKMVELNDLAESILEEVRQRNPERLLDATRLSMTSALCTYRGMNKPNRRYPNAYTDSGYKRVKRAESFFGKKFDLVWEERAKRFPDYLLLEKSPFDPGMCPEKQNHYLNTGEIVMLHKEHPDMQNSFNDKVDMGLFGEREW
jgi:hypothetical protein